MIIKILGAGCSNCKKLYHNALLAIAEKGIDAEVIKVTDYSEIADYNVMRTPALVIDDKVVSYGKVASKEEILEFLN